MAQRILKAHRELSRELGIGTLTPEYEILVALLAEESMGTEELCAGSSLSRSGFFHTIDRLKHWRLISCESDPEDRRRKTYRLEPQTAQLMIARIRQFRGFVDAARGSSDAARERANEHRTSAAEHFRPLWQGDRVPNTTCEYQMLIYLMAEPGATNGDIVDVVSASPTKCHASLAKLVANGLVIRRDDPSDKRRKRYFIAEAACRTTQRAHATMFAWLDEAGSACGTQAPPSPQPRIATPSLTAPNRAGRG